MKIKELFEDKDNGSLIGKRISGKLITTETENEIWPTEFKCDYYNLTSLEGAPQKINGDFNCSFNKNLTSLEGAPQEGVKDFYCFECNLMSLEGAPKKIQGNFYCGFNSNLGSLKGAPQNGVEAFNCGNCNLTSLEGAPKKINGIFSCEGNPITSLKGIHNIIEEINGDCTFPDSIESNILGLLKIKNLKSVYFFDKNNGRTKLQIVEIINKYLPNPTTDKIIDCQNELIDAGFEEYADL